MKTATAKKTDGYLLDIADGNTPPQKGNIKIEFIFTFFEGEQKIGMYEIPLTSINSERSLKNWVKKALTTKKQSMLSKVSCCIYFGKGLSVPSWYSECHGKLWFNIRKRKDYGLN